VTGAISNPGNSEASRGLCLISNAVLAGIDQ
jgi:hypothetical protein